MLLEVSGFSVMSNLCEPSSYCITLISVFSVGTKLLVVRRNREVSGFGVMLNLCELSSACFSVFSIGTKLLVVYGNHEIRNICRDECFYCASQGADFCSNPLP